VSWPISPGNTGLRGPTRIEPISEDQRQLAFLDCPGVLLASLRLRAFALRSLANRASLAASHSSNNANLVSVCFTHPTNLFNAQEPCGFVIPQLRTLIHCHQSTFGVLPLFPFARPSAKTVTFLSRAADL
jgi:hypothetical protein